MPHPSKEIMKKGGKGLAISSAGPLCVDLLLHSYIHAFLRGVRGRCSVRTRSKFRARPVRVRHNELMTLTPASTTDGGRRKVNH